MKQVYSGLNTNEAMKADVKLRSICVFKSLTLVHRFSLLPLSLWNHHRLIHLLGATKHLCTCLDVSLDLNEHFLLSFVKQLFSTYADG